MERMNELSAERSYTERVQQLLLAVIESSRRLSGEHEESIQMILADAWDELRLRPTALSPEEMDQLALEVGRFTARRKFAEELAERSMRMLENPFFARIDFVEDGSEDLEKIVIGMYTLRDEKGDLLVHDWRAPICSLYYDAVPGKVSYRSPSGVISGEMPLKRQYRMEKGKLSYYVDTSLNIDDTFLLDILSRSTSQHMHNIVSTIQSEQNAAIRCEEEKVVSVVGAAGSGKTSVAMHRAAYLMYRQRDLLEANRIQILSPSTAFSEYISTVLPELGEEIIRSRTLHEMVETILNRRVEHPVQQTNALLVDYPQLRCRSTAWKCGPEYLEKLRAAADRFADFGPEFTDIVVDDKALISASELERLYRSELKLLNCAQRLERMRTALDSMLDSLSQRLYKQFEQQYAGKYRGKELVSVTKLAVSQQLQPARSQIRAVVEMNSADLLDRLMLEELPDELRAARVENRRAGLTWWEDAVAEAWLMVRLGFVAPDKSIYHLLIDEAQDYSDTALALLHEYYPRAKVTLLGDPMQRTNPGMPACQPERWGGCFGEADAPTYALTRCYRSTLPIARLCNAILTDGDRINPFGREGDMPEIAEYSIDRLRAKLNEYREKGMRSIAVITRTQAQADSLADRLDHVYRFDGGDADLHYERGDNVVSCFHLTKGMEFDAVIAIWPECELDGGERRRLYTACSRALHNLTLLTTPGMIRKLAIAL